MICPSCREPLNYPSGDGCAAMKLHKECVMTVGETNQSRSAADLIKRDDALKAIDTFKRDFEQSWKVQFSADIKALPAVDPAAIRKAALLDAGYDTTLTDRIEEVVKERDDYKDLYYAGFKDAASLNIHYAEVGYKAKTAEAKLAKAVEMLILCGDMFDEVAHPSDPLSVMIKTTLAELEGK